MVEEIEHFSFGTSKATFFKMAAVIPNVNEILRFEIELTISKLPRATPISEIQQHVNTLHDSLGKGVAANRQWICNHTHSHTYIYLYIHIYVCVCVAIIHDSNG